MIVITIVTQKSAKEMLEKWVDRDYWIDGDSVDTATSEPNLPSGCGDKEVNENLER